MSNKRGTGTPVQNGPSKSTKGPVESNAGTFISRLNKAYEALDEVVKDATGREAYDKLMKDIEQKTREVEEAKRDAQTLRDDHQTLTAKMQDELAKAKAFVDQLQATYDAKYFDFQKGVEVHTKAAKELNETRQQLVRMKTDLENVSDEKVRLEERNAKLKQNASAARHKITDLTMDCESVKLELSQAKLELSQAKLERDRVDKELLSSRKVSRQLHEDLGALHFDRTKMDDSFEDLAQRFHELVFETFISREQHFPDNNNTTPLVNLSSPNLLWIPQVASNSPAARYMRCAFAEAVVAETLTEFVFNNGSLASAKIKIKGRGSGGGGTLGPLVAGIDMLENKGFGVQATFIKWQLVKVCQHPEVARRIARKAARRVCKILGPWLDDGPVGGMPAPAPVVHEVEEEDEEAEGEDDDRDDAAAASGAATRAFQNQLATLFGEALALWQTLQRTNTNPVATAEPQRGGIWHYDEDTHPAYNNCPITGPSTVIMEVPTTQPIAVLFPRILARVDLEPDPAEGGDGDGDDDGDGYGGDGENRIIFHGYVLFPRQPAFLAAHEELSAQQRQREGAASPTFPRRDSTANSRRRLSRGGGGGGGGTAAAIRRQDSQSQGQAEAAAAPQRSASATSGGQPRRRQSISSSSRGGGGGGGGGGCGGADDGHRNHQHRGHSKSRTSISESSDRAVSSGLAGLLTRKSNSSASRAVAVNPTASVSSTQSSRRSEVSGT